MGLTLCTAAKLRSAAANGRLINRRKLYEDVRAGKRRRNREKKKKALAGKLREAAASRMRLHRQRPAAAFVISHDAFPALGFVSLLKLTRPPVRHLVHSPSLNWSFVIQA